MDIQFSNDDRTTIAADALVVLTGSDWRNELAELDAVFDGKLVDWLDQQDFEGKGCHTIPTFGRIAARALIIAGTGNGDVAPRAAALAKAGRVARQQNLAHLAIEAGDTGASIEQLLAGNYEADRYIPEQDRHARLATLTVIGKDDGSTGAAMIRAKWQTWCRDLVNMPAADLYPETLAQAAIDKLGPLDHVAVEVWDFERCRREGLVGLVAVGQGSARPGCLIHVRYRPNAPKDHVAFVGKGVTFDAGGLSIKPSAGMQTMRCDMGGAATVLAAIGAIAEQGLPVAVDCVVGAVENMTGGAAFKLGDILRYRNGVTVEIHNTDAEGRLVLADCLINACAVEGVTKVVDAATLTGASMIALGEDFAGLWANDDDLANALMQAADANHELLWRMPLHAPYKAKLKGTWSQIKNLGGRYAGATTAALYLQYFVAEDIAWAHLDIAGSSFRDDANARWAAGGTGELVRTLTSWVASL